MKRMASDTTHSSVPGFQLSREGEERLTVVLSGSWNIRNELLDPDEIIREIQSSPQIRLVSFRTHDLSGWDSSLVTFLLKLFRFAAREGIEVERASLPNGVVRLLDLALAVPEREDTHAKRPKETFVSRIGESVISSSRAGTDFLSFLGEVALGIWRLLSGKTVFRKVDLVLFVQQCGVQALPIISLISVLFGLILAFIGAVQLETFGAEIYVADLVGIAMARDMGAMMCGIVMAGRTGASYAAQLGTMQVNEEIDALKTLGISPVDFLVLPRMLALVLMMPLLCVYSDLMGILGGALVGGTLFDISLVQYMNETQASVGLQHFWIGIFKSLVYGIIVSMSGCLRGMQCGRSALAVGEASTSAVVTSIVWIIVSCALLTVMSYLLDI